MTDDPSAGWEAVAGRFAALRSDIGVEIVTDWARQLPPGGSIVDIGCGTGDPNALALAGQGFCLFGIDPAPTMIAAFRQRIPGAATACERAEASRFFDRQFDAALAIGLLFLLPEAAQRSIILQIGRALHPGGHVLFTAPPHPCAWTDNLTGKPSRSLGAARYRQLLAAAGCDVIGSKVDTGGNHYHHARAMM
ncbi:class I SAM-dependent methyltransferase [Sandarakinorhabdus sp.]|uniref:class I SAM-dependent methyltransferase n=1 Tax=Sandarakinorhabdus sp. TaxID=1916663 RepID=UPI003F71D7AB